ncbi:methyl-accepting chemotaxis sensory transducer with Cache sensor [Alteribacillus persepolensis]|uniref:Methyl-accepting chemotaxis sensory transducer with Cache sensor n=1 Tax=Alteribacillus persepolensis TaxID=568899 RepID=A0A1G8J2L6_9BACI|nr:methyl-accepting chemotaxis protein [Alteribacillus persepolensis]SDI25292.1 methyl-accepting chemotaxis sensory transducer with Cache sensor [Alteribacillus persepolensis]
MRKRKRVGMKKKLVASFLLVGLLPMLTASWLVYNISSGEMVAKEKESMETIAENLSMNMEQWLDKRLGELRLAAATDDILSNDLDVKLSLMNYMKNQDDVYETVVFTDTSGIVRAHTTTEHIGALDLSEREYFQSGMNGETAVSDILTSNSTGNRIIVIAAPVEDDNGDITGVLSASVNFDMLTEALLQEDGQTDAIVIDRHNVIQHHPTASYIDQTIEEAAFSQHEQNIVEQGRQTIGSSEFENNGKQGVIAYAPVHTAGLGLYLQTPMETILSAAEQLQLVLLITVAAASVIIILFAGVVASKISKPIQIITDKVKQVADGDVTEKTVNIHSRDEVGELASHVNKMTANLRDILSKAGQNAALVSTSSEQLHASSEQSSKSSEDITASMQQVASGAETQKQHAQENAAAIDDMAQGIEQMAASATDVSQASHDTLKKAEEGGQTVQDTYNKMETIQTAVQESNKVNQSLTKRSQEIESIVNVISDISEQTNLLALNAAIEAARAGEHGKGFAVVAEEVRKLAAESQQSSKQIADIIGDIQRDMQQSASAAEHVSSEVDEGLELVHETKQRFEDIQTSTTDVAEHMDTIASASEQLSATSEEMAAAFSEMSRISEETSASTQSVAAASEEQVASMQEVDAAAQSLREMAVELNHALARFTLEK